MFNCITPHWISSSKMVKSLTCSTLHTREVTLPNCKEADPRDCERVYHIVLPRILCHSGIRRRRLGGDDESDLLVPPPQENEFFEGTYKRVGTLPLVFALHAFKEDARSMEVFTPFADSSHFVLVLPEGKEFSFNGGDCCGAARHNGVNDVAFLTHLKQELNREFHQFLELVRACMKTQKLSLRHITIEKFSKMRVSIITRDCRRESMKCKKRTE